MHTFASNRHLPYFRQCLGEDARRNYFLDQMSDALSTAVAVLAVECEKHYFGTTLGPFLKQSEKENIIKPERKYTFGRIQSIVCKQSAVQTTVPHT